MTRYTTAVHQRDIRKAAELISSARCAVALTGAGSSTPSGIPDFRSNDIGLWNRFPAMEVASLTAFRHYPEKFFEWLRPLANDILNARPNASHIAFFQLESSGYLKTIITQNIDGLHQRAGSRSVIEIHGSLNTLSCTNCFQQVPSSGFIQPYIQQGRVPYCSLCGKILKPDVVLFEEQLPNKPWLQARQAAKTCDLMIVAGSSLVVMPAAGLPANAFENSAKIIVVNKTPTYIDEQADVVIYGDVANVIPAIVTEVIHV